ncbi:LysR family transcriptional regulator [Paraburkholderia tropica]|uniref:LysR family transcriptional regulator n=1 Tax=Paraburkholderia tropica TaxID=92647 RepID=UPI0032B57D95
MDFIQNIKAFVLVAENGNFTSAADQLGRTPTFTSRAVSQLESRLQTRLLNRSTKRIALTESGRRYLNHAVEILRIVNHAEEEISLANKVPMGLLRLFSADEISSAYVIPLLANYLDSMPSVEVELAVGRRVPDLINEAIDIAIVQCNSLHDSNYVSRSVGKTFSVLCASVAYLKKYGEPMTPEDLNSHTAICLSDDLHRREVWRLEHGSSEVKVFSPKSQLTVRNVDSLIEAIANDVGVGAVPLSLLCRVRRSGIGKFIMPELRVNTAHIWVMYPSRRYVDAKTRVLVEHLVDQLPSIVIRDRDQLRDTKQVLGHASSDFA